jgi:hypothetical protein
MKEYGGVDICLHVFLTSALFGGEWSALSSCRCTPEERAPRTHWIGGWVGPKPVWMTWRGENSRLYRDSNSEPSVVRSVTSRYTD